MLEFLRSLRDTSEDAMATLRWLLGVVVVLAALGLALGRWLHTLNTIQVWSFWIGATAVIAFMGTLAIDYVNRRAIERIPDLMERLNKLVMEYIDNYKMELTHEEWLRLLDEYGVLLNVSFQRLRTAMINEGAAYADDRRAAIIDEEWERIGKAYDRKLGPNKKITDALSDLRDMGGLLNNHNIGLARCTGTPQYQHIDKRIRSLQRRVPSAVISAKVNDFYFQSEGFYCLLLGMRPLGGHPEIPGTKVPVKAAAKFYQVSPIVEGQIATLIASVRESIDAYRNRNRAPSENKKT